MAGQRLPRSSLAVMDNVRPILGATAAATLGEPILAIHKEGAVVPRGFPFCNDKRLNMLRD